MARKKKAPEHANHERWLVSYADFMTLLFAFFVVMFANSATKPEKVEEFVGAVRNAFNSYGIYVGVSQSAVVGPPDNSGAKKVTIEVEHSQNGLGGVLQGGQTSLESEGDEDFQATADKEPQDESLTGKEPPSEDLPPSGVPAAVATPEGLPEDITRPSPEPTPPAESDQDDSAQTGNGGAEGMKKVYEDLQGILAKDLADLEIEMKEEKRGIVISLKEAGFFDSGSADIKPKSMEILNRIAAKLASIKNPYMLRVEGHTDNQPLRNTPRFHDNWDLSSGRANAVIHYFVEHAGYSPNRMMASGYGEWHPVAKNDTAEGRARNRRVDLVILNEEHADMEP